MIRRTRIPTATLLVFTLSFAQACAGAARPRPGMFDPDERVRIVSAGAPFALHTSEIAASGGTCRATRVEGRHSEVSADTLFLSAVTRVELAPGHDGSCAFGGPAYVVFDDADGSVPRLERATAGTNGAILVIGAIAAVAAVLRAFNSGW